MKYIAKRILQFIPTLLLITLITFGLTRIAPGDPVESRYKENVGIEKGMIVDSIVYRSLSHEMGLDKPVFYFTIHPQPVSIFYLPRFHWNGSDNQYQHWLFGIMKGDFGTSYSDQRTVADKLATPLLITLAMSLSSMLLSFGLAVPLGVYTATHRGSRLERLITNSLFAFYAVPLFWLATLAVVFLTNNSYSLKIASVGLEDLPSDASGWVKIVENIPHFILPVACISLHSLAFIARQMRGSMVEALEQEYIKTAKAKGLGRGAIVWKHAFRNSLFPLITLIGQSFSAVVAGSLVVEIIFNIPGMGWEAYKAVNQNDYPMVYAVVLLGAIMTLTGSLIADILYRWANPRL